MTVRVPSEAQLHSGGRPTLPSKVLVLDAPSSWNHRSMPSAFSRDFLKLPTMAWALKAQLKLKMPLAHSLPLHHQPASPGGHPGFPHLGKHIRVGVVLQKDCGCSCVVVASRDVQGGQAHFPFRPIVDEVSHHVLMTLLQSHSQWGEAILVRGE